MFDYAISDMWQNITFSGSNLNYKYNEEEDNEDYIYIIS